MKKFFLKRKLNLLCSVAAIVLMWLMWFVAYHAVKNDYIIPSFTDTMVSLWQCLKDGAFWKAVWNTLLRTVWAFALSFLLAAFCAALSSVSKIFRAMLKPFMVILRILPTLAVILLLLIWCSTRYTPPIIVTVLILFPVILAQFQAAIGDIDGGLIQMAKVYSVKKTERLFKIYLPLISPNILSQTGANLSLGLKVMVSAEVMSNTAKSLGGMMQYARSFADMPRLAALTVAVIIVGLILDVAFSQLSRITYRWSKGEASI